MSCITHPDKLGDGIVIINEQLTRKLWDKFKRHNIRIIGKPEDQEYNIYKEANVKYIITEKIPEIESS